MANLIEAKSHELMNVNDWEKTGIDDENIKKALTDTYASKTIYERLDSLIALSEACEAHQPPNDEVAQLKKQADLFIAIITNSNEQTLAQAIEDRKSKRDAWPTYLPNTSLRHTEEFKSNTRKGMIKERFVSHAKALGKGKYLEVESGEKKMDEKFKVKMLSDEEKEKYRIMPASGLLWEFKKSDEHGKLERLCIQPFDTSEHVAHKDIGKAIFVLNPQGELFAGTHQMSVFHHSSFQRGGYTAYGGTMVVNNGLIERMSDHSGHYRPQSPHFLNMLMEFKARGIDTDHVELSARFQDGLTEQRVRSAKHTSDDSTSNPVPTEIDRFSVLWLHLLDNGIDFEHPIMHAFFITMENLLAGKDDDNSRAQFKDTKEFLDSARDSGIKLPVLSDAKNQLTAYIADHPDLSSSLGGTDWVHTASSELHQDEQSSHAHSSTATAFSSLGIDPEQIKVAQYTEKAKAEIADTSAPKVPAQSAANDNSFIEADQHHQQLKK